MSPGLKRAIDETRKMSRLTKVRFSQQASFIAKNAAAWSADCLDLIEDYPDMRAADVARFTDDMRSRLDRLDKMAGRAALASHRQENEGHG